MIYNIEMYILIFFVYSFTGWCMESFGSIINPKVKKFVNRGFMIGPYCPVYGIGVVLASIFLNKYINDIPVLFVLTILICGALEYFTGYIMEKLFNARWWDYSKRKFNINGRVCLETLIPFGIAAIFILCKLNPLLLNFLNDLPLIIIHIITATLSIFFIIDFIISFRIILSFRGEVYSKKDNTEEISEKVKDKTEELGEKVKEGAEELGEFVKDKAEDVIMKTESDLRYYGRKYKLKFLRKTKYTRKRLVEKIPNTIEELAEKMNSRKIELAERLEEEKEKMTYQVKLKRAEYELKQKETKQIINNKINNLKNTSDELNKQIIEKFKSKSLLRGRLINAFPTLEIKENRKNKRKNNIKLEK